MKTVDHRQVAALHAQCMDQGFLGSLGVPFLTLMYRAIEESESSILLVEEREGKVLGFVSGGIGMGPIYRRMLRRPFRLAWSLAPSIIHPRRVRRILEILRYSAGNAGGGGLPDAELLSIVVDPQWRGKRLAEKLYLRLSTHFAAAGVPAFRIVVGEALTPAHKFYRKMGAVPAGQVAVHGKEVSVIYVQAVPPPEQWGAEGDLQDRPC